MVLEDWTGVIQPMPNQYSPQQQTCFRIGRCWVSRPSNLFVKMQITSHVVGTPEEYYGNDLSGHSPFVLSFGAKLRSSSVSSSISKSACKHLKLNCHVASLASYRNLVKVEDRLILLVYKMCLKEAARMVREETQLESCNETASWRLVLATISSVIWFNKLSIARRMMSNSVLGRKLLQSQGGKFVCKDDVLFDAYFNGCHKAALQKDIHILRVGISNAASSNT